MKALLGAVRPGAYALLVVATVLGAGAWALRRDDLFACQASGYAPDRYLAYCQAKGYGDYDYGAFWFGLEPETRDALVNAQVLFLGNSRMQFGLSTPAVTAWFRRRSIRYYLAGFAYDGNSGFVGPLLRRLAPSARMYVINVDMFFEGSLTPPARAVMQDSTARSRYLRKRVWQPVHRALCGWASWLCGHEVAFFRSRPTGEWVVQGGRFTGAPVVYHPDVDSLTLRSYAAAGRAFVATLPVQGDCVLLTDVPTGKAFRSTGEGTARAVARALGLTVVAPAMGDLRTFDGSHLDSASAERWSSAFIEALGPRIRHCLD